ncbi:PhoX family phosphatase [Streptomyces sp. NBC_00457]|uniref:PhoX family protein n=1 Tax=Streptomyces sp. NBC_00457 TaxID=2975748 RepID=UPI002E2029B5
MTENPAAALSRRSALISGTATAAGLLIGSGSAAAAPEPDATGAALPGFVSVPADDVDSVRVPAGYVAHVLAPWGQPLRTTGPAWREDGGNTAAEQARQIGTHHSGLAFHPLGRGPRGSRHGMLVIGHEYADGALLHPDGGADLTTSAVDKALAAVGVSFVEVRRRGDVWQVVDSPRNTRVTGATPVAFAGPVTAGHPRLGTGSAPLGVLGSSATGNTPWGTYLVAEENFHAVFGTDDTAWHPTETQLRYGLSAVGHGHRWHRADPRFDLAVSGNEPNRFGWVVEIDPLDPRSAPVKHTALGRFSHSGATVTQADGRAVVYSGDGQDGGHVYKFVAARPWGAGRAAGRGPLDEGTLYVARFHDDGAGEWLPLVHGRGPLTGRLGWTDQADVLLRARQAADALGATPLDRPQQIAVDPRDGGLYCALANSTGHAPCASPASARPGAVRPRRSNPYGHIIRWREDGGDAAAGRFRWEVFVLAGDPAYDDAVQLDSGGMFASPKGLSFDAGGRLWIRTGASGHVQNRQECGHDRLGNNALLVADPGTRTIRRFLTGPRGAEITGVALTPDRRTLFVNVQHPGERSAAWGTPTPRNPRAVSNWPDHAPEGRPRSATVAVSRSDGGVIGAF